MARSQRHLLSLINDVLNFTRLETGHVEYRRVEFEVPPLLLEVVATLEPMLRPARLQCAIAGDAIEFTLPGGTISCDVGRRAPGVIEICVRDTGVGIEPAKLESIFEPFVQLRRRPLSPQDGVGLGLAISRDLARGMGGELTASSVVGEGTALTLVLPEPPRGG